MIRRAAIWLAWAAARLAVFAGAGAAAVVCAAVGGGLFVCLAGVGFAFSLASTVIGTVWTASMMASGGLLTAASALGRAALQWPRNPATARRGDGSAASEQSEDWVDVTAPPAGTWSG